MTIPSPTPKQRRATRQAEAARVLDASLERHKLSRAQLAAKVGVPEQHAHEWATAEADRNMQLADAAGAPHLVRIDLAEYVAPPGCVVCVLPATERADDDLRVAANIARGGGVVLEKFLTAAADGRLDDEELAEIRYAVREQLRALASFDLGLAEAQKNHGRPLRLCVAGGVRE